MLPTLAAALLIAYASAVPVNLAAEIILRGGKISVRAGVSAFAPPVPRPIRRKKRARKRPARISPRTAAALILRLLARARVASITADGTVCARTAMATALICGGADIIGRSLRAAGVRAVRLSVRPDFSDGATDVRLQGIISIRAGQIILAAALCAADRTESRFLKWKDR